MPVDLPALLGDLAAETQSLMDLTGSVPDEDWGLMTPAPGWTIADQIGHLAHFDAVMLTAAVSPAVFEADRARIEAAGGIDPDTIARGYRHLTPAQLRSWFEQSRNRLLSAFAGIDPALRVPWFGPPMSAASALTSRVMETWAHGQDVADALGVKRVPTDRLRHVAHIGVGARAFSFVARGRPEPAVPVRVELIPPSHPEGPLWTWGPVEAVDRVRGSALDFCLLVTQRRHRRDTDIQVDGPVAAAWMLIAQAFAGPPGAGRRAGQFQRAASEDR